MLHSVKILYSIKFNSEYLFWALNILKRDAFDNKLNFSSSDSLLVKVKVIKNYFLINATIKNISSGIIIIDNV